MEGGEPRLAAPPALPAPPARPEVVGDLTWGDLGAALAAGWDDFRAMPRFGLFFGGVYVFAGLAIGWAAFAGSNPSWLIPAIVGFPLIAPFVAVGLYEASRRRAAGEALTWRAVLGALKGHGDDQILSMGVIVFVAFSFWMIVAHAIFAIFVGESGMGRDPLAAFLAPTGLAMLAVGTAVGAVLAFVFYAMTVISLPLLVDHRHDFLTAIIASLAAVRRNPVVMLGWAAIIAALLLAALLPAFLGLFVVLPVLGHATWHLYVRAVR